MSRRRFYAPPGAFSLEYKSVSLGPDECKHLRTVLRLEPGDEIYVFDGEGREFQCVMGFGGRECMLGVISEVSPASPESPLELTLALALLKGEKFDLVVQKATELGVARIQPLITARADVRLRDEHDANKRAIRWQRIALEAAKQSGRACVPEVATPMTLDGFLQAPASKEAENENAFCALFSERDGQSFPETIAGLSQRPQKIIALIGSEGGWADDDIARARAAGWNVITLGGRTLRAETAAIAITVLLQHVFGDLF